MQTDNEKYNETVQPNTAFLNELKEKLPEFFTKEGSFDLNKFRNQLKDKNVKELSEGYRLDFIGKDYARRQAGEMPSTVIVPDEKQNKGEGKNSKNLFFTGDNLEVLRHLQNNYQNKINVIYIDPPYNTGNKDFIYDDVFEYSDNQLMDMFGLTEDQLERLKSIQGKSSHSSWLTFMYPRLSLARHLLNDEGIIFISIDDNEYDNLKEICDELFGEVNFIGNLVWKARVKPSNQGEARIRPQGDVEYVLVYAKNTEKAKFYALPSKQSRNYPYNLNGRLYRLATILKSNRGTNARATMHFSFQGYTPDDDARWQASKTKIQELWDTGHIEFKNGTPFRRYFKDEESQLNTPFYNFMVPEVTGSAESGKNELNKLIGNRHGFDTVKPTKLIKHLLKATSSSDDIILDFFAGSGTTAQSVMELNIENETNLKFILVQLPEKTYHTNKDGSEIPTNVGRTAYKAGFKSIDEISRERIRRAAQKIREDNELTLPEDFDGSFKHYRVVKPVKQTLEEIDGFDPNNTNLFTDMVDGFSSKSLGIDGDATGEETILTTWLAKDGYPFDADVEEVKFDNYSAHKVENNRLYLINEGWGADQTKELLNQLGTHQLEVQSVVIFGYSFNVAELRELENGLKQLDSKVTLIKRY